MYLGEASYSIYMTHGLVLISYVMLEDWRSPSDDPHLASGTAMAAGCVVAAVSVGAIVYEWIESPARAALRAFRA